VSSQFAGERVSVSAAAPLKKRVIRVLRYNRGGTSRIENVLLAISNRPLVQKVASMMHERAQKRQTPAIQFGVQDLTAVVLYLVVVK
jgi:hypothetical protein